jgi:outer membrane protein
MNKQLSKTALLLGLLAWPLLAWAQSPPAGPPAKVGVINIQAAIASTAEGKKALADLDKKYAPRRQDLQEQSQAIAALQDQLNKGANTLSDEEQRNLNRQLQEKQTRFKRAQEDAQADFSADSSDVVTRVGQKLVKLMSDYAQQNNYAVIVESNPQLVYYAAPQVDLTEEMVKRYDAANPVADAPGPNLSAPPAAGARPPASRAPTPRTAQKPKP